MLLNIPQAIDQPDYYESEDTSKPEPLVGPSTVGCFTICIDVNI